MIQTLLAACLVSVLAGQYVPPLAPIQIELENVRFEGGAVETWDRASGGRLLGDGWGHRVEDFLEVEFELSDARNVAGFLRYAYDREQYLKRFPGTPSPRHVLAEMDGRPLGGVIVLDDTADWRIFTVARIPLGKVATGRHRLRLRPARPHTDLNLDRLTIADASYMFDTRHAVLLPETAGPFRIRVSPRADRERLPADKIRANLLTQYTFHRKWLGYAPREGSLLTVVADEDWPNPGASAWTGYGNLYINEKEAATPGGNYSHEMFHYFEAGHDYPTWWSEGVAYVISMRSDRELYGRGAAVDAWVARLKRWWESEGRALMVRNGRNVAQWWGSDRVPEDARRGLYNMANLMLYSLWEREGDAFFERFYKLLRGDIENGAYRMRDVDFDERNLLLMDYARRAARTDLRDFWKQWGMPDKPNGEAVP